VLLLRGNGAYRGCVAGHGPSVGRPRTAVSPLTRAVETGAGWINAGASALGSVSGAS
jgi:hypothetical protein